MIGRNYSFGFVKNVRLIQCVYDRSFQKFGERILEGGYLYERRIKDRGYQALLH